MNLSISKPLWLISIIWVVSLFMSGWMPFDRPVWILEVAPIFIVLPILWLTHRRFEFTTLVYCLILLHGLILMLGGAYTYARVPLGFWMQEWFGFARNNYDRIGHFAQGFIPAMVARELLIRYFHIQSRKLIIFLVLCIGLAVSALYELIEWWSALILGSGADEFLATQGDPWDTQADMFFALLGVICALLFLSRWQDKQIARKLIVPKS